MPSSKVKGKQIAVSPDGIATANINDGALSADAAGRLKMANGYFDNTTTVGNKFSSASIGLDRLEEAVIQADGGQDFTADQSMGGFELTTVGAPTAPDSAARLQDVQGKTIYKELILDSNQLLNGGSGGLLQAILLYLSANPSNTQTLTIFDGTTTETFTFLNSPTIPFDVQIGGTAAITQANLVAEINLSSTLWSATEPDWLDAYFAGTPSDQVVIYRTATSTNPDRIYGTASGIQEYRFDNSVEGYTDQAGSGEAALAGSDPTTKTFGVGRLFASLVQNETHTVADNTEYTWDGDDQVWQQTGTGLIVYGAVGEISTIQPDDAASAGALNKTARADHQHQFTCATPVALGAANDEGNASTSARSNHVHVRDGWSQEPVTTQAVTGVDQLLTDNLDSTPIAAARVVLFLNGVRQTQGAGNDYTVSGTAITWLAGTGTAVDLELSDELIAEYSIQGA